MVEGLVAVVVVIVFLAGMAYALSAVNQAPRAEVADWASRDPGLPRPYRLHHAPDPSRVSMSMWPARTSRRRGVDGPVEPSRGGPPIAAR